MRHQAARIADPRSPAHQLGKQLNLPPAYLLIHRVTLSTIGVLCQLGATVRLRDELASWLPGFLPQDEQEQDERGEDEQGMGDQGMNEQGPAVQELALQKSAEQESAEHELASDAPTGA